MASQLAHSLETSINVVLETYGDVQEKNSMRAEVDEDDGVLVVYGDMPRWLLSAEYVRYIQQGIHSPSREVVIPLSRANGFVRHVQAVVRNIRTRREKRRRGRF